MFVVSSPTFLVVVVFTCSALFFHFLRHRQLRSKRNSFAWITHLPFPLCLPTHPPPSPVWIHGRGRWNDNHRSGGGGRGGGKGGGERRRREEQRETRENEGNKLGISELAVAQRLGRVGRGVGVETGAGLARFVAAVDQTVGHQRAVGVAEQFGRIRPHGRQRTGRRQRDRRRTVVGQAAQVAQRHVAAEAQVGHGQRVRRQVATQTARAQVADAHVVAQLAGLVHRRHHGQHLRHFGLQFRDLTLARHQQICGTSQSVRTHGTFIGPPPLGGPIIDSTRFWLEKCRRGDTLEATFYGQSL